MIWLTGLLIAESALLLFLLIRRLVSRRNITASIIVLCVLCLCQIACHLTGFINLKGCGTGDFLFKFVSANYALECVALNFILVISAKYLLTVSKLNTRLTSAAFIFFWVFCGVEVVVFAANIFTGFVFSGTVVPLFNNPDILIFSHVSGRWMIVHQLFQVTLVLLIFISMLLKCSSIPLVYAGKYILIGIYFLLISAANYYAEVVSNSIVTDSIIVLITCGIPFLLYFQHYYYRPRFLLGSIRQMVFDRIGTPVVLFDDENLLADYNKSASSLFALEHQLINHLSLNEFLKRAVGNQMRERTTSTVEEVVVKSPSGQDLIFNLDYSKLSSKSGKDFGTLLFFHDITELKKLYNSMEKTAMTDPLTGLSSKIHLQKKITEINIYRKYPYTAVVCSINGINLITEGFGEDAGKTATMHVADLLRSQLRASDFAAYDSPNMVVLMPDTSEQDADMVFKRISRILNHDRTFNFSLSFEYGVASRPGPDSLMQQTVNQALAQMTNKKMRSDESVHQSIIDSLRDSLRLSSFETEQHSIRVQNVAEKIALKLKLPESELENLRNLAMFHDIGKLSVPAEILNKPDVLTAEETRIMQLHVINGYKIANVSKELTPIARGILCHHERWDGKGYPNGYAGEDIPFLARIISVADTFDVITHDRPYKVALPVEDAVREIQVNSGKQFDPAVVNAFMSLDFGKLKK